MTLENCCEVWKGDGQCDDVNNNAICEYDGGDCCGKTAIKQYCFNCSCLGIFIHQCNQGAIFSGAGVSIAILGPPELNDTPFKP